MKPMGKFGFALYLPRGSSPVAGEEGVFDGRQIGREGGRRAQAPESEEAEAAWGGTELALGI